MFYPASSRFLPRVVREKPMQATFCFSTEHAQVFHTTHDAFVKCQSKECNFLIKGPDKRMIQTFVKALPSLWSKSKALMWGFLSLDKQQHDFKGEKQKRTQSTAQSLRFLKRLSAWSRSYPFAVDLDFDRYTVSFLAHNSHVDECMSGSLNQLLNKF